MIELTSCCWGFNEKPQMDKWSEKEVLSQFDPLKEFKCSEDIDIKESTYESQDFIIHVLDNVKKEPDEFDYFHTFINILMTIEEVAPWILKVIKIRENSYIVAYERLDTPENTEYLEEIILSLIRLSVTFVIDRKIDNLSDFIKHHIEYNTVFSNEGKN